MQGYLFHAYCVKLGNLLAFMSWIARRRPQDAWIIAVAPTAKAPLLTLNKLNSRTLQGTHLTLPLVILSEYVVSNVLALTVITSMTKGHKVFIIEPASIQQDVPSWLLQKGSSVVILYMTWGLRLTVTHLALTSTKLLIESLYQESSTLYRSALANQSSHYAKLLNLIGSISSQCTITKFAKICHWAKHSWYSCPPNLSISRLSSDEEQCKLINTQRHITQAAQAFSV